jgi:hypothetical protein
MPNWGKRKHRVRAGSMKGYKPKTKTVPRHAPPVLSAQDRAALANMQPVVIRTTSYPTTRNIGDGCVGEYSIRSCNNNRR